MKW
ncbi:Protein of unknown function [Bacillus mycoides]|jgi:hypothetical protein